MAVGYKSSRLSILDSFCLNKVQVTRSVVTHKLAEYNLVLGAAERSVFVYYGPGFLAPPFATLFYFILANPLRQSHHRPVKLIPINPILIHIPSPSGMLPFYYQTHMSLLRTKNEEDISLERLVSAISGVVEDLTGSRFI